MKTLLIIGILAIVGVIVVAVRLIRFMNEFGQ